MRADRDRLFVKMEVQRSRFDDDDDDESAALQREGEKGRDTCEIAGRYSTCRYMFTIRYSVFP